MTDKEKAIVIAYAGICMLNGDKFDIFHKYVEELMGRPVYTYELGFGKFSEELKRRATPDFIALCKDNDSAPEWIPVKEKWAPEEGGTYLVVVHDERIFKSGYGTVSAYYNKKENQWVPDDEWIKGEVVAWMPMPEPYKVESEE